MLEMALLFYGKLSKKSEELIDMKIFHLSILIFCLLIRPDMAIMAMIQAGM